jgi:uncharacterized membrane protein YcaP (DUF421 family)
VDETIVPLDLQRMLLGTEPPLFYLEIVVRTAIVYAYALLLLRWLGSRTIGQLSTVEFLLVIALGSAIGDAMFYPEVPLLHALLVVTVVVFANKGLDLMIVRSKTAERMIDGSPHEIVENGVLNVAAPRRSTIGRSEIFQQLRHRGIVQLGEVRHAYVEPDGMVTVFRRNRDVPPGLPIVPPWEVAPPLEIAADQPLENAASLACMQCGTVLPLAAGAVPGHCPN